MDEVDNIIIHTFRQIGCDIPEEVSNLREFTTPMIVAVTSKCIRAIKEDLQIPAVLPASMSSRFRLGTTLAAACQEIGYKGEIGYQTFLYSNEADIRRLFMFLVENLPKESSESASEPLGSSVMLNRRISAELSRQMSKPWTPSFCKKDSIRWSGKKPLSWYKEGVKAVRRFHAHPLRTPKDLGDLTKKIPKDVKLYYSTAMPFITLQPPCRQDLAPSVLEANAMAVTLANEWENEWNQSGLASRLSKEEYLAQKKDRLEKKIKQHLQSELQRSNLNGAANPDLSDIVSSLSDRASGTGTISKGSRFTRTEQLQFAQIPNENLEKYRMFPEGIEQFASLLLSSTTRLVSPREDEDEQKAAAMVGLSEEGPPKVDTEEEMRQKREEEIESLQSKLSELNAFVEQNELEIKKSLARIQQTNEQVANQKTKNSEQEEAFKVKRRTADLLPDAENNIAKLQSVVDSSAERLVSLAQQWEKHRVPLIEEYRELKELNATRVSEAQKQLEEIKALREKMKEVADEARGKEDVYKQLVVEYETMRKDVNRSAYTRRILEIVGNIKKQKEEINKILVDTKDVQKEINQLSGKLDRTFAVTDELIFKDAKKDEFCRKAYKHLASLHQNCKELIRSVEDTGLILREIRDLEDQIETEGQKNTATNLERISADLKQMKDENNALVKKVKASKS